jgi:hypothetical protein
MMFNFLRIQGTRVQRQFQELIRPVVDKAVRNAFERYEQKGVIANNPKSKDNFITKHHVIINTVLSTFTFLVTLVGVGISFEALQVQQQANKLQEELIRSQKELAQSNRELTDTLNKPDKPENSWVNYGMVRELVRNGWTMYLLEKFIFSGGKNSGRRRKREPLDRSNPEP